MRSAISLILFLVCATVMAQTEVITTGEVPMGIVVYDYLNDKKYDISEICDGFDDEGTPINLVLPQKARITLFFPTITKENAANYYAISNGKRKLTLDKYNLNYEYEGRKVSHPVSESSSGNMSRSFALEYRPGSDSLLLGKKIVELKWKTDRDAIEWNMLLDDGQGDEFFELMDLLVGDIFNQNENVRSYEGWLEKGYAIDIDENGIPISPTFPYDLNRIYIASSVEKVSVTHNGKPVEIQLDTLTEYLYYFEPKKSGNYILTIESPEKVYGIKRITYPFSIEYSFWNEGGYYLLSGIGAMVIFFWIYRINTKRKLESAQLQKQLSAAELKAVRSQLNPHFLFNALNAIQNLVNQNNTETANDYIVKLSKLLRTVLAQSDEALHSLENEINLSRLYLELEHMRSPFDFNVEVDPSVDMNALVPNMILQPYLENAVIHGIHKNNATRVTLSVKQINDLLELTISDNGKPVSTSFQEGNGMALGRNRLEIIKKQLGDSAKIGLKARSSSENGFIVEIRLPADL